MKKKRKAMRLKDVEAKGEIIFNHLSTFKMTKYAPSALDFFINLLLFIK